MRLAITRVVSPAVERGELTYLSRQPIDVQRAREQHAEYEAALSALGYAVLRLPAEPDLPDSVFVEDTALVLDELAVITRPGAPSRQPEVPTIIEALKPYRSLKHIEAPATIDGGDVLRVGRRLYVGLSKRSTPQGIDQLAAILAPHGYSVQGVEMDDCLHLKSAVTQVGPDTLLINRQWVDAGVFTGYDLIDIDPSEPMSGNALYLSGAVIFPEEYPATRQRLEAHGIHLVTVPAGELAKVEGGVTCCSLILEV